MPREILHKSSAIEDISKKLEDKNIDIQYDDILYMTRQLDLIMKDRDLYTVDFFADAIEYDLRRSEKISMKLKKKKMSNFKKRRSLIYIASIYARHLNMISKKRGAESSVFPLEHIYTTKSGKYMLGRIFYKEGARKHGKEAGNCLSGGARLEVTHSRTRIRFDDKFPLYPKAELFGLYDIDGDALKPVCTIEYNLALKYIKEILGNNNKIVTGSESWHDELLEALNALHDTEVLPWGVKRKVFSV